MGFVDMAHSHVQRLLREGFELDADEIVQDRDGDYPFRWGTAAYYLTVHPKGRGVRIWSNAVHGVKPTLPVLREVNDANSRLIHGRVYVDGRNVVVEAILPVEPLTTWLLVEACREVGRTADELGSMLATVYGGHVAFDEEVEAAG